jgi:hypothetical protein
MAIDASGVLGSRQLAGVKVNPPGYAWRQARNQAGTLAAGIVHGGPPPGRADTPPFGRLAYLAVTDQELALVKLRSRKAVMLKAAEVIARVPRSQLQTAELGPGYAAPLTIIFGDGGTWRLEVPPPSKRYAREVMHALGGRIVTKESLPSGAPAADERLPHPVRHNLGRRRRRHRSRRSGRAGYRQHCRRRCVLCHRRTRRLV